MSVSRSRRQPRPEAPRSLPSAAEQIWVGLITRHEAEIALYCVSVYVKLMSKARGGAVAVPLRWAFKCQQKLTSDHEARKPFST
ncbi:hypothetical protein E4U30_002649 [Claviceps sp. LM220 group G6]|nr:hypothetical protein E4U15_005673 [Claviceps sp. LM218 group G6]KAG6095172.1 hypothetical protein E4U30_002649 [Claviceps sp. LM220 group G6]KAG6103317.1 hypothetical protein E4U31_002905 [Claviceps sp. LM219 group G6]KAG6110098.1 hypothetical protein E4U14_002967 [Claviceps sp. LM454 group G7]